MALTPQQDLMNQALDNLLDDAARAALNAQLDANPDEAYLYSQLVQVNGLLQRPPTVVAPVGFAQGVLAAIRAGRHEVYARPRLSGFFLVLGLTLGAVVALPLLALALVGLGQVLVEPDALIGLLQGLIQVLGGLTGAAEGLLTFLGSLVMAYPMVPALLLTVIPMVMLWGWLLWFLQQRNRPPTIIVKVHTGNVL
jgi:hypothetical protein